MRDQRGDAVEVLARPNRVAEFSTSAVERGLYVNDEPCAPIGDPGETHRPCPRPTMAVTTPGDDLCDSTRVWRSSWSSWASWLTGAVALCAVGALASVATVPAVVLVATVAGTLAAATDLRQRRIPDLVVVGVLAATTAIGVLGAGDSRWASIVAGAAFGGGLLLVLHLISPQGMGFGDVKFAGACGALLGVLHWSLAGAMLMVAGIAGSLSALVVPSWRRSMPFGLFLAVGALVALAAEGWITARFDPIGAR